MKKRSFNFVGQFSSPCCRQKLLTAIRTFEQVFPRLESVCSILFLTAPLSADDSVAFVVVAAVFGVVTARVDSPQNQTSTVSDAVIDRLLLGQREMVHRRQFHRLVPLLVALRYPVSFPMFLPAVRFVVAALVIAGHCV